MANKRTAKTLIGLRKKLETDYQNGKITDLGRNCGCEWIANLADLFNCEEEYTELYEETNLP